jgi:hypothetical protein
MERVGELVDCEDPFAMVLPNSLCRHAIQQTEVVSCFCLLVAGILERAVWAVLVKDNRWRLRGSLLRPSSYLLKN